MIFLILIKRWMFPLFELLLKHVPRRKPVMKKTDRSPKKNYIFLEIMEILHAKTKERQLEVRCPINDNISCWQKGKNQVHEDAKCQKELTKTKYYTPI